MTISIGSHISHYEILAPLGAGAMGEVYRAKDTKLGREVAIKVLPEHFAEVEERVHRFEREAKSLASLNHPNVAQIFGVDRVGDICFLVLELVEGESLEARLKRGALPVDEALDVCRQIAEGLEAAHDAGVIHRDLKPANVRVTPDGKVKVLDFGLAKPMREDAESKSSTDSVLSTEAGRLLGTPTYMAPEQARGKAIDKRVDIWAFGCVLYECLTAKRAFAGDSLTDVLAAVIERNADMTVLPPATPLRIRELLGSCLDKDRKNRLRDIGDARLEIERAIAGREWTSVTHGAHSRRGLLSIAGSLVAAVVLLATGAGLWSAWGPQGTSVQEPICVTLSMPSDVMVQDVSMTPDGRTIILRGRPRGPNGSFATQQRIYTRRLDSYDFKPVPGTDGVLAMTPTRDSRAVNFTASVSSGSVQKRLSFVPLDGSAPSTTIGDIEPFASRYIEMENGDLLIVQEFLNFFRIPKTGGVPSPRVKMDAGRAGVYRIEFFGTALPGDRAALVNVVSYGTRGFQYSVGVLDISSGRVKVVVEDGGNAVYSPSGHLVFARGDVILAALFDLGRAEIQSAPVAVWGGLQALNRAFPADFRLTNDGTLCYRPQQSDGGPAMGVLGSDGKLEPWLSDRMILNEPPFASPDGRRILMQVLNFRGIDEMWVATADQANFLKLRTEANVDSFIGAWSPDGEKVAYTRFGKDDRDGIYIQSADGGESHRVYKNATSAEFVFPTAWFPDNSALIVTRILDGKLSLALIPLGEKEADLSSLRPLLPSELNRSFARLSSDGRLVLFHSEESGLSQSWLAEMRPGGEVGRLTQIRTPGAPSLHAFGTDGRTLYIQDERDKLLKFTVKLEPRLSVSEPVETADLEKLEIQSWTPLSDGRFFVVFKRDREREIKSYNIVLNWTSILKSKVPATK